jgi:hypothetical protein
MLCHCHMALVLLLRDLRAPPGRGRGIAQVSAMTPSVPPAIRPARAHASCREQTGVIWCNWIVVNAFHITLGVRRVASPAAP